MIPKMGFSEKFSSGYFREEYADSAPPAFDDHYELLGQAAWALDAVVYDAQDFWELGHSVSPRTCAFCDKTQAQGATFKKISHAIAENLGNKRVISLEECDTCNETYSHFEMELARMLVVERVFGGSRGKSGPVSLKAGDLLDIKGKGVGNPVRLEVDGSKSPIRDTGPNSMEIPIEGVEYRPLPAMRSMLRSAWLLIPKSRRDRFAFLKLLATGQVEGLPFQFLNVFSAGAPLSVGRIRVWGIRETSAASNLPPLIVSLSLFNTTLVWRAPFQGTYVRGPLPPLPVYEDKSDPEVSRMAIAADEKVTASHTFNVTYSKKVAGEPPTAPTTSLQKTAIDQLREATDVQIGVGESETTVSTWIEGRRQVKKISADFLRVSHAVLLAPNYGMLLTIKSMPDSEAYRVHLQFNAAGLPVSSALIGLSFAEAYAQAKGDVKLFVREGGRVGELPLQGGEVSGFDGTDFKRIREDLMLLGEAGQILGVELQLPTPTQSTELSVLVLVAKAIVRGVPGRFRDSAVIETTIPLNDFERLSVSTELTRLCFGTATYPFAGIPELTEERIGPVVMYLELPNPSLALPAAVIRKDGNRVELRLEVDHYCFAIERFLRKA